MSKFMIAETLVDDIKIQENINGITVSPKKNFCIIKLWFNSNVDENSIIKINKNIKEIENFEGIFKRHI
jgi:hypothetical protein